MNKKRQQAEELIYNVFDAIDKTHTNSDYYKKLFANMTDKDVEDLRQVKVATNPSSVDEEIENKMEMENLDFD